MDKEKTLQKLILLDKKKEKIGLTATEEYQYRFYLLILNELEELAIEIDKTTK